MILWRYVIWVFTLRAACIELQPCYLLCLTAHRYDLLKDFNRTFHRLRQSGIDEELFEVISGFEALSVEDK